MYKCVYQIWLCDITVDIIYNFISQVGQEQNTIR